MKNIIVVISILLSTQIRTQIDTNYSINQKVIETVEKYGPSISPTYQSAVCTELVIGVLGHLCELNAVDKSRIRIIVKEDVYGLMDRGSPVPKGVYYALTSNGKGTAIDSLENVLPGDFVQFWYPHSWGHCGIVQRIDPENKTMMLYSSFPSTDGYGIQEFEIPEYCYFVRLNSTK